MKLPEEGRLPWMAKGQKVTVARQHQGGGAAVRQRRPAWGRLQKGLNVHATVFQPNPTDFPSLEQEEPEEDAEGASHSGAGGWALHAEGRVVVVPTFRAHPACRPRLVLANALPHNA